MLCVDSNIWCYYFTQSAKEHLSVVRYLDGIIGKEKIVMNTIVAMEVVHHLIKKFGALRGSALSKEFLSFPFLIDDFEYEQLVSSVKILSEQTHTGIGGRDATILATMKKTGVTTLVTNDQAFKKISDITVIDPVTVS